jgi:hypothetical protein
VATGFYTEQQLESMILELVHRVRDKHGFTARASAEDVCAALGLNIRFADLGSDQDGLLRGREVIINRKVDLPARMEYTIFHEVIHFLLEDDGELYEYLTEKLSGDERAFNQAIERWCQLGAAEFMLPRSEVHRLISREGFSVKLISVLMSELGASLVASGIQLAVCAPVDCYVLVCRYGRSSHYPNPTTLYVEQASQRIGQKYVVARGTTIPKPHPLWDAWESGVGTSSTSIIPFRSGKFQPCLSTEAIKIGSQVAGLLCLGSLVSQSQLKLEL